MVALQSFRLVGLQRPEGLIDLSNQNWAWRSRRALFCCGWEKKVSPALWAGLREEGIPFRNPWVARMR